MVISNQRVVKVFSMALILAAPANSLASGLLTAYEQVASSAGSGSLILVVGSQNASGEILRVEGLEALVAPEAGNPTEVGVNELLANSAAERFPVAVDERAVIGTKVFAAGSDVKKLDFTLAALTSEGEPFVALVVGATLDAKLIGEKAGLDDDAVKALPEEFAVEYVKGLWPADSLETARAFVLLPEEPLASTGSGAGPCSGIADEIADQYHNAAVDRHGCWENLADDLPGIGLGAVACCAGGFALGNVPGCLAAVTICGMGAGIGETLAYQACTDGVVLRYLPVIQELTNEYRYCCEEDGGCPNM